MNTFFDLREFLITILKKMRFNTLIIVLCVIGGFFSRFIPLTVEYMRYDEVMNEQIADGFDDYPYEYEARRTIYIEPIYKTVNGETIDASQDVISTYLACYQNKEILQPLAEKYYKDAAILYNENQEKQVKYQFITSSAKRDFMLQDFYSLIRIKDINKRLISVYVKSSNSDFSEKLVDDTTELLNKYVKSIVGEYAYTITEGQIGISLPTDTTGVVIAPSTTALKQKNSLSYIVLRSVKGAIWGFGGGLAMSLILCFFFYSVSQLIYEEDDLLEFNVPILASLTDKTLKSKPGIQNRLIAFLRGNTVQFSNYEECGRVVCELIKQKARIEQTTVALTGSCEFSLVNKMADALNADQSEVTFTPVGNLVYSADALQQTVNDNNLLLIEKLNESSKVEIARELQLAHYLGKNVLGFIIIR